MAVLALALVTLGSWIAPARASDDPAPIKKKVQLAFRLDWFSADGAEIEVKPANAACKFETIKFKTKSRKVSSDGLIRLDPIDIETQTADGSCSFLINIKEPGQPDKVVRRTLRMTGNPKADPTKPLQMTCYITSASLATKPGAETKKIK